MTGGLNRWDGSVHKTGGQLIRWDGSAHKQGGKLVHWDGTNHKIITGGGGGAEPSSPVFVNATSRSATGGTPTDASVAAMPSGWASGDLLIAWFIIAEATGTFTPPAGYTALPGAPTQPNVLTSSAHWVGYKVATGSESVPVFRDSVAAIKYHAGLAAYRNAVILNQLHPNETVNQATHTAPDIAVGVNDLVLRIFMEKSSTNLSWSLPTSHTLRSSAFGSGGGACSGALFERAFASAGQAGTAASTASTSSAGVTMASIGLAGVA